jgi:hypothetical protein
VVDDVRMQNNNANQTPSSQPTDPAELWWGRAAGQPQQQQQRQQPMMIEPPALEEPWRWRYSWAFGIMYGPIPVGILIGIPLLLLPFSR